MRFLRLHRLASPAVAVAVLALYAVTAYPGLAGGDSGELAAAAATGGVIHPPGYPLYALLGRLFAHLPIAGSVAGRLNVLSALCDAAGAGFLSGAVRRRTGSRAAGLTAAAAFALAPIVWQYALCAEVFALNNLLVAALVWLSVRYDERAERTYALAGAVVVGLGLSNHHTFLFVAAPLTAWVLWRGRADLGRGKRFGALGAFGTLAGCVAAGLLPYAYLPYAASAGSPVSWGAAGTWSGFWTHVLRREYGTLRLAAAGVAQGASPFATLGAWADAMRAELGVVGVVVACAGLVFAFIPRRRAPLSAALVVAPVLSVAVIVVLGNLPVSDGLHRGIVARFWQQPWLFASVFCGEAVAALERRVPKGLAWAGAAALILVPFPGHFATVDRHTSTLVRAYGAEILRAAPPGALLVTKGDLITSSLRYLQAVEGARPDVKVVDEELLGYAWYAPEVERAHPDVVLPGPRYMPGAADAFTMKDLLDANWGRKPILICGGIKPGDASAEASYGRWPFSFCERVERGDAPVNVDDWIRESEAALPRIDFDGKAHPEGSWEGIVWSDFWEVRQARAVHLIALAGSDPGRRRLITVAVGILEGIVAANPDVPAHVYRNLAMALGREGFETADQRARAARAWRRYLETGPEADPERPAIEKEVARLEGR